MQHDTEHLPKVQMTDEQFEAMAKAVAEAREAALKQVKRFYDEGIAALEVEPRQHVRVLPAQDLQAELGRGYRYRIVPGTTPQVLPAGPPKPLPYPNVPADPPDVRICFVEQVDENTEHLRARWEDLMDILSTQLTQRIVREAHAARVEVDLVNKKLEEMSKDLVVMRETTDQAKHKAERARAECDALSHRLQVAEKKLKTLRADIGERRAKELLGEVE